MGFPSKLKNLNFYIDGVGYLGETEEVELPKVTLKTDDYRGGGMIGTVEIDMGVDKLELGVTMAGLIAGALKGFGLPAVDGVLTRFAGAFQNDQTGAVQTVEIACLGRWKEVDWGNAKAGDNTQHKYKLAVSYYRLTVDGVDWLEIDLVNAVFNVFGTDRYAQIRAALGVDGGFAPGVSLTASTTITV